MGVRKVLVLGDHSGDWFALFKSLLKKASGLVLTDFLQQAAHTIRREIKQDAKLTKSSNFRFTTAYELADQIETLQAKCPLAIRCAIICLSQIGHILAYEEVCPFELSNGSSLSVTGYGVGSIAAAAFASTGSPSELAHSSDLAIAIAFRVGSIVQRKIEINTVSSFEEVLPPWACLALPLTVGDAEVMLREFNQQNNLARHRTCYISSVHASETVISGPRSSLKSLQEQRGITGIVNACPIPLNASHLYCKVDLDSFKPLARAFRTRETTNGEMPRFISGSGEPLQATSSTELILQEVQCLLLRRRDTVKQFQALNTCCSGDECTLFVSAEDETSRYFASQMQSCNGEGGAKIINICAAVSRMHPQRAVKPSIAVVGMAGRFPEAEDADHLWELLQAGREVHRTVPPDRFNYASHSDPTGKKRNTSKSPYGCFINDPGLFDHRFFNMSPKEAAQTDPAQRLMLLTAYEALEMAGFVSNRSPSSRPDRVATFYGQTSDDWRETNSCQDIGTYFIPGGIRAFGPGRINYHLKFSGPSYSVDTACSSSFAAIHMACNSLLARDCDTAIVGGANILTNPDIFAGLSRGQFLSSSGPCKTFDADADGYCRGDAVGSVVLKRLEDAEDDNDKILGVILGVGTNHSADAVSITHPHAPTQATLYQSILSNNGVNADEVDYVEMHGTGTAAGDYNEMLSVSDVFASRTRDRRPQPLYVSSIKANIGHGEAAAGISSLIKVLLMLRNSTIPSHVGIKGTVNPAFPHDLEARNVHIPFTSKSWLPKTDVPRIAFLNNFSAAGGNTSLLLREYRPLSTMRENDPRSTYIISVNAKTIVSLQMNIERLATFIKENPNTNIADLSYTLTARRLSHPYRRTFTVSRLAEVRNMLVSGMESFAPVASKPPKTIFTFTGQGSLYSSLARQLFDTCNSFRHDILELDYVATTQGLPSFLELVDGSVADSALLSPVVSQVGQVCVQVALARLWISWGIQPSAVVGHSLGEYPALVIAGVLTASDMIYLVGHKAQLFLELSISHSHGMLAVNADAESLRHRISGTAVEIACINAPKMTVLGGPREALDISTSELQAEGIRCTRISVTHAYHTAQVDAILTSFRHFAEHLTYAPPQLPVLSPLLCRTVEVGSDEFDAEYLCRQAREIVNFQGALSSIRNQSEWTGNAIWLEVGPHPTCTRFVQQTLGPGVSVGISLRRNSDSWKTMSESLCSLHDRGFAVDWEQYHHGFEGCHNLMDLPAYAWDLKNFWIDYKNDWSLTKGDALQAARDSVKFTPPRLATTTVQRIVEEKIESGVASLVAETAFSEPDLAYIALGHRVNGVSLCPSSLYADMALTVAKYLYQEIHPNMPAPAMDVYDMHVDKPFILDQRNDVLFRISAKGDEQRAQLQFYTVDKRDRSKRTDHAYCEVRFDEFKKWSAKWDRKSYLIEERLAALDAAAAAGKAHRIQRGLVYRLLSSFVDYDDHYQGIEELILDSSRFEASATVVLKPTERGSVYEVPPTWIDSFCHLSGVILNASDAVDSKKFVFISHGWKSLRLLGGLKSGISYRTYTRMQESDENIMEGDVWIFNSNKIVGVAKGIKFQRIPRKVVDILLPKPGLNLVTPEAEPQFTAHVHSDQVARPYSLPPLTLNTSSVPISRMDPSIVDSILKVISSECSVDIADLVDGCTFASLGIDSLLSLEILAKLRELLEISLPPHVFIENETMGDLKVQLLELFVGSRSGEHSATPPSSIGSMGSTPTHGSLSSPRAVSFLLSGNLKTATKYLFLFPDGSGSATSYTSLSPLGSDVAVLALNCPFMTTPSSWQNGINTVMKYYLDEIRQRQPNGPYNLGGWSAGGVLAYEAAYQIQQGGDRVERLILIDSPCPVRLPPMPNKMFDFFDSIGLLGRENLAGTPSWVIPHFAATVRNLQMYLPLPISPGQEPATTAIWARRGVTFASGGRRPEREPEDPMVMEWLLEDRTDFQYNGWDSLIAASAIRCEVMDGHHFSMINEHVNELGRLMAKAMC